MISLIKEIQFNPIPLLCLGTDKQDIVRRKEEGNIKRLVWEINWDNQSHKIILRESIHCNRCRTRNYWKIK